MTDAVIFDLDGTLLDTLDDLHDSVNETLSAFGYPPRSRRDVRGFVGNGVRRLIHRAFPPNLPPEVYREALAFYHEAYRRNMRRNTRPYDGVPALLAELSARGVKLAVVSNKPHAAAQALVQEMFGEWIRITVGEGGGVPPKPAPDGVLHALSLLDVPVEEAVYVGDSDVDVQTAHAAGLFAVGCTWGFRDRWVLEEAGADAVITAPTQLIDTLESERSYRFPELVPDRGVPMIGRSVITGVDPQRVKVRDFRSLSTLEYPVIAVSPGGKYRLRLGLTFRDLLLCCEEDEGLCHIPDREPNSPFLEAAFVGETRFYVLSASGLRFYETEPVQPLELPEMRFGKQNGEAPGRTLLSLLWHEGSGRFAALYLQEGAFYRAALFSREGRLLDDASTGLECEFHRRRPVRPELALDGDRLTLTSKHLFARYEYWFYAHRLAEAEDF